MAPPPPPQKVPHGSSPPPDRRRPSSRQTWRPKGSVQQEETELAESDPGGRDSGSMRQMPTERTAPPVPPPGVQTATPPPRVNAPPGAGQPRASGPAPLEPLAAPPAPPMSKAEAAKAKAGASDAARRARENAPTAITPAQAVTPIGDLPLGARIGPCIIQGVVGRGSMGAVYRAHHCNLGKTVAIKLPDKFKLNNDEARTRFLREARAAARLEHPNVVQIYDVQIEGNQPYIIMQYLEGESVRAIVKRGGPMSAADVCSFGVQVLDALAVAHEKGFVHRDIKPDNIMLLAGGAVKVTDFGLVRDNRGGSITEVGIVLGTPNFMAPEVCLGRDIDGRADIYSLACTIHFALVGRAPYESDAVGEILARQVREPFPKLAPLVDSVTPELDDVIQRMGAKNRSLRFADAREALEAFEALGFSVSRSGSVAIRASELNMHEDASRPHGRPSSGELPAVRRGSGAAAPAAADPDASDDEKTPRKLPATEPKKADDGDADGSDHVVGPDTFHIPPELVEPSDDDLGSDSSDGYMVTDSSDEVMLRIGSQIGVPPSVGESDDLIESSDAALHRTKPLPAKKPSTRAGTPRDMTSTEKMAPSRGARHEDGEGGGGGLRLAAVAAATILFVTVFVGVAAVMNGLLDGGGGGETVSKGDGSTAPGPALDPDPEPEPVTPPDPEPVAPDPEPVPEPVVTPDPEPEPVLTPDPEPEPPDPEPVRPPDPEPVRPPDPEPVRPPDPVPVAPAPDPEPVRPPDPVPVAPAPDPEPEPPDPEPVRPPDPEPVRPPDPAPVAPAPDPEPRRPDPKPVARPPARDPDPAPPARPDPEPPVAAPAEPIDEPAREGPPRRIRWLADGSEMVLVPAGLFWRGGTIGNENPQHEVELSAFYVDVHEVTRERYAQFLAVEPTLRHLGCRARARQGCANDHVPPGWTEPTDADRRKPVEAVSYYDAVAYVAWAGKRLLTEAEWEKAARGDRDKRLLPWGSDPESLQDFDRPRANLRTAPRLGEPERDGFERSAPVGSFPAGVSPFGAHDMVGNVSEWVKDDYVDNAYQRQTTGGVTPRDPIVFDPRIGRTLGILRGGSYLDALRGMRLTIRQRLVRTDARAKVGFRCGVSLADLDPAVYEVVGERR